MCKTINKCQTDDIHKQFDKDLLPVNHIINVYLQYQCNKSLYKTHFMLLYCVPTNKEWILTIAIHQLSSNILKHFLSFCPENHCYNSDTDSSRDKLYLSQCQFTCVIQLEYNSINVVTEKTLLAEKICVVY